VAASRSDAMNSPTVGTSHSSAMTDRNSATGPWVTARTMRPDLGCRSVAVAVTLSVAITDPPGTV
jgi:hypothetical protein